MTLLLKKEKLEIRYKQPQNVYNISINFLDFPSKLKNLSKNNVFFSTYNIDSTTDGFICLNETLYFRCSIIHKLGAIAKIDDDIREKDLIKLKLNKSKKTIIMSIFPEVFKELSLQYFDQRFYLNSPLLSDFYIDLSLASNEQLIGQKWHENTTPNYAALRKDYIQSDKNRINWSPNTDGERRKNELFTGSGSNLGGRSSL